VNSLNNSDERAVFDAVAGIIRPIMAMRRAPNGASCDVLFIFVARHRRVGVGHGRAMIF